MPSDGSGNYSLVGGYLAVANTAILTTQHNPILEDIAAGLTARIMASGAKAMTGPLTLSGDPASALHAAPKQYVDAQVATLLQKASVIVRTTGNITLSGEQTLDGVLTSASRVLVASQTAAAENGVYVSAAGAWARSSDFDAWTEVPGALVTVQQGTLFADSVWLCTGDAGGTIGSTAVNFIRLDKSLKKRNTQSGTTYTVLASDHGKFVTTSNGSAIAVTVPQATTFFGDGFWFVTQNLGAGAATFTPTTSTVNGAATLVLRTGDAYMWFSDGANYIALPVGPTYAWLIGLTEDATGATGDFVWTGDVSATLNKKVQLGTIQALFAATQAQMETATSNLVNVTPLSMNWHPGVAKCWGKFDFAAGISASWNITSLTDTAAGRITVTIATDFSSVNYAVSATNEATASFTATITAQAAGTIELKSFDSAGTNTDSTKMHFIAFGDQ